MSVPTKWEFEADYITLCNCDWGCPCNFNARPTYGDCVGWGAFRITRGTFGDTKLDGAVFIAAYAFPGLIEEGNAITRLYVDAKSTPEQQEAIRQIYEGKHGGGMFEIFANLSRVRYPSAVVDIDFRFDGPQSRMKVDGVMEVECEPLAYPDGTVIAPTFTLPHGIEFKTATAANARRWWIRDRELSASHENKYVAYAHVKFDNAGCVG